MYTKTIHHPECSGYLVIIPPVPVPSFLLMSQWSRYLNGILSRLSTNDPHDFTPTIPYDTTIFGDSTYEIHWNHLKSLILDSWWLVCRLFVPPSGTPLKNRENTIRETPAGTPSAHTSCPSSVVGCAACADDLQVSSSGNLRLNEVSLV